MMTPAQIDLHEKDYQAAADRRFRAKQIVYLAEKALFQAREDLDKADRICREEWRKLSRSLAEGK
jgi:hypothetical protein